MEKDQENCPNMKEREGVGNRKILECTNRKDRRMKENAVKLMKIWISQRRKKLFPIISDMSCISIFNK
jgi:hypothetical protein